MEWTSYGPPGIVNDIAINPNNSHEWFISTRQSGFFKSNDSGKSWKFSSSGIPVGESYLNYNYTVVKYDPVNPEIIYAGTGANQTTCGLGLYKSTDGGNNWIKLSTIDFSPASVREIEINPQNTSQVFISEYHCDSGGGLYRSDDSGLTWKKILTVNYPGPILFDTTNGIHIYTMNQNGSFWKSSDNGDSWDTLITSHNYRVRKLIRDSDNNFLFTEESMGVFRILNEKEIIPANDGLPVGNLAFYTDLIFDKNTSSFFITAYDSGLFRSTNNGVSWENVFREATVNKAIVVGDSLVIGTECGFYSSKDNGLTWNHLKSLYGSAYVNSVACVKNTHIVYSSTESGLFKSTDSGNSWEYCQTLGSRSVKYITVKDGAPYILYAAIGDYNSSLFGIFKSENEGKSWRNIAPRTDKVVSRIEISKSNPDILYSLISNEIWKSTDGGETWNRVFINAYSSPYYVSPLELKIAANNPDIVYASFNGSGSNLGIFVTTDGGSSWTRRMNVFPHSMNGAKIGALAIHPEQPSIAYAGNYLGEIYKSTDFGLIWTKLSNGLPNSGFTSLNTTSLIIDDKYPSVIFASFSGEMNYNIRGMYKSTDDGNSWVQQSNDGMYNNQITCICKNSIGEHHEFYAGTYGGGIFKYTTDETLPVELVSFSANPENFRIDLTWSTGSEKNNLGFAIERQKSGSGKWKEIGFCNGNGTTSEKSVYSFSDTVNSPGLYSYRLQQIDYDGKKQYSNVIEVKVNGPARFSLEQNYPNPFNPATTFKWSIPTDGRVILKIYNINGAEVVTLIDEIRSAGNYTTVVDINNLPGGKSLASGVYLYKLISGSFSECKKLILLK